VEQDLLATIRRAYTQSDFLRAVALVQKDQGRQLALGDKPTRALRKNEITQLTAQENSCLDWSRVRVVDDFD
jgi:hypothetical protein